MRRVALLLGMFCVLGALAQAAVAQALPPEPVGPAESVVPPPSPPACEASQPNAEAERPLDFLVPAPKMATCDFTSCGQAWDLCRLSCDGCPWEVAHCNLQFCAYDCICHWEYC
jgi:hypothetical protein